MRIKFGLLAGALLYLSGVPLCWGVSAGPIEVLVEMTEVDVTKAKKMGIEWLDTIKFSETRPEGLMSLGSIGRLTRIHADLHFLIEEGAADILAKPNLVTDSGTTASFHAGGQIPYITSSSLGSTHVEFKPYGVAMHITPRLLKSGKIKMTIHASVSAPDESNGVLLSGNTVPAIFDREVKSTVTVHSGTAVTLAGLVQTHKDVRERGVPFLRAIPVLGRLFRWRIERFRRTSIIIFVTPRIVKI